MSNVVSLAQKYANTLVGTTEKALRNGFQVQTTNPCEPSDQIMMNLMTGVCSNLFQSMTGMMGGSSSSETESSDMGAMFAAMFGPICNEQACIQEMVAQIAVAQSSAACVAAGGPDAGSGDDGFNIETMSAMMGAFCAERIPGERCYAVIFNSATEQTCGLGDDAGVEGLCCMMSQWGCCYRSFMNAMQTMGGDDSLDVNITAVEAGCDGVAAGSETACSSAFLARKYLVYTQTFPGCDHLDTAFLQEDLSALFGCPAANSGVRSSTLTGENLEVKFQCDVSYATIDRTSSIRAAMALSVDPATSLTQTRARSPTCGGTGELTPGALAEDNSSSALALVVSGFLVAGLALL